MAEEKNKYLLQVEALPKNDLLVIAFELPEKIKLKIQLSKDYKRLKKHNLYVLTEILNLIEDFETELYFIPCNNTLPQK
jgi:hypothetical protein